MSIRMMSYVWDHSQYKGAALLLMLALADYANDETGEAWPSIPSLAEKIRMSERYTQKLIEIVGDPEFGEVIIVTGKGLHHSNRYTFKGYKPKHEAGFVLSEESKHEAGFAKTRGGVRENTRRGSRKHEAGLVQTIINHHGTTTEPPEGAEEEKQVDISESKAAAAVVEKDGVYFWTLEGLLKFCKPAWTKGIPEKSDPLAFVSHFLYATTSTTWKFPAFYAAKMLREEPGRFASEPFESLARSGPCTLALVAQWIGGMDHLFDQINGVSHQALAWRGMLPKSIEPESVSNKVLSELGLLQFKAEGRVIENCKPEAINPLQELIDRMMRAKAHPAAVMQLAMAEYVASDDGRLVIRARHAQNAKQIGRCLESVITAYLGGRELVIEE